MVPSGPEPKRRSPQKLHFVTLASLALKGTSLLAERIDLAVDISPRGLLRFTPRSSHTPRRKMIARTTLSLPRRGEPAGQLHVTLWLLYVRAHVQTLGFRR